MKEAGQVVLFRFPRTDWGEAKLRPAILLARLPGPFDDWLACMISSQLSQAVSAFDEVIATSDPDFATSGLRAPSVIRVGRLAVVERSLLLGAVGQIGSERLDRIKQHLRDWLS